MRGGAAVRRTRRTAANGRRGERAQALAEMSIILPVMLVLLIGVVECVNAFNHFISVTNSARDGARIGSKGAVTDDEIRSLIANDMSRLPSTFDEDTDVTIDRAPVSGENAISVTTCYDHELLLNITLVMPETYRMCSTTVMKMIPTPEPGP
jgi:hypothetical protein